MASIYKRTKILAGVGPATDSEEKIEELMQAGVNGFRFNFSHGANDERVRQTKWIRDASKKHGRAVAIVQDLQGPKIRLGELNDNRQDVKQGDEIVLDYALKAHDGLTMPVQYNLAAKVEEGQSIYLFDGKIRGTVIGVPSKTAIKVRIENDGFLMSKKGINLPDTDFGGDILTKKDIEDIEFGATQDYDYVALSFVQSEEDIHTLRQMLVGLGSTAHIIAKVETKAAIHPATLEAIVKASDGVMVARGDLAVEVGSALVPIVQRRIVALCRQHGKLSIVATQMLASMVDSPEPTRAEVSDVATAVVMGSDAVMLSDETANGSYPIHAAKSMRDTILYTQEHWPVDAEKDERVVSQDDWHRHTIATAAVNVAESINANVIIAETKSGATAANISSLRPHMSIIAVTSDPCVAQQLALNYGTRSFVRPDGERAGLKVAKELLEDDYFGDLDEVLTVIVSGRQPGLIGGTDTLRVRVVK